MSTIIIELYDALKAAGVDEDKAKAAAQAVIGAESKTDLATRTDLAELQRVTRTDINDLRLSTKADLANLEASLIKWNVGAIIAMTAVFAAIVKLL